MSRDLYLVSMVTTTKKYHNDDGGVVSKTVDTKMLQTVRNNDISFGKVVAHCQLFHLVINKINHIAMVATSKNPKWRPSAQVSDFICIFFKTF